MAANETGTSSYLVLARKYRPQDFSTLIGQDAMVRTLTNAFKANRIAHAFMLTGVRGVGKTTTARILARALNYADESGPHPTLDLEKEGTHCRAIIESRHVDVVEMDAASHTGIDDIREIIDSTRYGPVSAPYKIFIIDEVHMLSKSAFNGLLKTLEEPPPYVKFIFATTEIRKVPVTILSRCQRFDLRRVPADTLTTYLGGILEKEGIGYEADALSLVVRAGEGSVRDALSLLDQAIAHGGGKIDAEAVRSMLGLADRAIGLDMFEALMKGEIEKALEALRAQYDAGADPVTVISDLANITHLVTRLKVVPRAAEDPGLTPDERDRGGEFAKKLGIRILSRAWQMLLKGLQEVQTAPDPLAAAEMVLIRIAHASDLPSPDELIEKLNAEPHGSAQGVAHGATPAMAGHAQAPSGPSASYRGGASLARQPAPSSAPQAQAGPQLSSFTDLVALARDKREILLQHALEAQVSPVSFETGRIEVALTPDADPNIIQALSARLKEWTGRTWMISVSSSAPITTIKQQHEAKRQAEIDEARQDPVVRKVFDLFPGARLVDIRPYAVSAEAENEMDPGNPPEADPGLDDFQEDD
ncbi:DNA polymerase III subunit gamma/tau [Cucumibacter marinus]|uniref:DNA polymerase III subunit gamma/tau n=1 Tax=Cucumibacter marinus TaxID=1121252 RepID=UPI00041D0863|nr:DNA polymerase III subunit gamma/tau [Cucumibacter marinus]